MRPIHTTPITDEEDAPPPPSPPTYLLQQSGTPAAAGQDGANTLVACVQSERPELRLPTRTERDSDDDTDDYLRDPYMSDLRVTVCKGVNNL